MTPDPFFSNPIETKTTVVKTAEPLKLKSNVFAKGFKVEITWNLDPNNPINIDQLMLKVEDSNFKKAVMEFIKFNESLGYEHLKDKTESKESSTTQEKKE